MPAATRVGFSLSRSARKFVAFPSISVWVAVMFVCLLVFACPCPEARDDMHAGGEPSFGARLVRPHNLFGTAFSLGPGGPTRRGSGGRSLHGRGEASSGPRGARSRLRGGVGGRLEASPGVAPANLGRRSADRPELEGASRSLEQAADRRPPLAGDVPPTDSRLPEPPGRPTRVRGQRPKTVSTLRRSREQFRHSRDAFRR